MTPLLQRLSVVCHQVRSPDNLGAIARLMANFGLDRLYLSAPVVSDFTEAHRMAVHAVHIVDGLKVFPTLDDALAECVYAVGSTSRADLRGRVALSPEAAVSRLSENARRGPVALILGGEQRGLSDDELARCQDVLVIPTEDAQPSMNLAQAAAVLLYLCSREERTDAEAAEVPGARLATVKALEDRMEDVFTRVDFLNPQAPEYIRDELLRSLVRSKLTQREAELWLAAFAHIRRQIK